eukprot:TRINITY_DN20300_c1_g1_i1.p2 TRINITY_DN20300_c1_g1~~TRINITY_DN20300_c1_g1_i1.p2  ORF type:complete len:270 (+),score=39.18 TRINITY_DN20300_c1_g1_i1:107-811(+)
MWMRLRAWGATQLRAAPQLRPAVRRFVRLSRRLRELLPTAAGAAAAALVLPVILMLLLRLRPAPVAGPRPPPQPPAPAPPLVVGGSVVGLLGLPPSVVLAFGAAAIVLLCAARHFVATPSQAQAPPPSSGSQPPLPRHGDPHSPLEQYPSGSGEAESGLKRQVGFRETPDVKEVSPSASVQHGRWQCPSCGWINPNDVDECEGPLCFRDAPGRGQWTLVPDLSLGRPAEPPRWQ